MIGCEHTRNMLGKMRPGRVLATHLPSLTKAPVEEDAVASNGFIRTVAIRKHDAGKQRRYIAIDELHRLVSYDPQTGEFTWRISVSTKSHAGGRADKAAGHGYRKLFNGHGDKSIYAHRAAWAYVHGQWPVGNVDHINGDPSDNRIENLRLCSQSQNIANSKLASNNTSGFKGVSRYRGAWRATITVNRRQIGLGMFKTPEEAANAREKAAQEYYGAFARAQ